MLERLRARLGWFEDGTSIKQISREEYLYRKPDGHSVVVYVWWVTGKEPGTNRVLVKSSIAKWVKPTQGELISEEDQRKIIETFGRYFDAYRETLKVD